MKYKVFLIKGQIDIENMNHFLDNHDVNRVMFKQGESIIVVKYKEKGEEKNEI